MAPISVIIPCYRSTGTIERALKSVLAQSLQPSEIILVDDGSGDETLAMLLNLELVYKPLVRVISLNINGGPGLARNAGWDVAKYPWLAFLDSDDIWSQNKLQVQWNWLLKNSDVSLCGHLSELINKQLDMSTVKNIKSKKLSLLQMLISNKISTRTVMLRRDIPFRFGGRAFTEDYLLWLQIISAGLVACRLESVLAYSFRPEFSPGGYSGYLWAHEKRELSALFFLYKENNISLLFWLPSSIFSLIKYVRRVIINRFIK
jgi:glycosyltransferase involved in cell wall biosynthesis